MRLRMVLPGALWLGLSVAAAAADDAAKPPRAPLPETKAQIGAKLESDAKAFGVTVAELKRLREFGYADAEIYAQLKENHRTARQLITEREVVDTLAKALAEVGPRIHTLSPEKQETEREKAVKDALTKIRRERKATRDEIRQILTKTSFFRDDEIKRVSR